MKIGSGPNCGTSAHLNCLHISSQVSEVFAGPVSTKNVFFVKQRPNLQDMSLTENHLLFVCVHFCSNDEENNAEALNGGSFVFIFYITHCLWINYRQPSYFLLWPECISAHERIQKEFKNFSKFCIVLVKILTLTWPSWI